MTLPAELHGWIGREARYTAPEEVGRAAIRYFARAVGDDNPVYTDDDAARAAGHDGVVAPPTYVCESNQYADRPRDADGYIGHTWDLPVPPGGRVVRGGHRYVFGRPVRPSDVVSVLWRVADIAAKTSRSGAPLLIVTSESTYTGADGAHLATNTDTTIHTDTSSGDGRGAPATPAPAPPAPAPPAPAGEDLVRTLDSAALVAYAGATWDWYRTHHDAEAARAVGLPRPIVDGQMLGALLAEHAQDRFGPRARIRRMDFRFAAMAFAGDTVRVTAGEPVAERADGGTRIRLAQRVLVGDRVVVGPAETVLWLPT